MHTVRVNVMRQEDVTKACKLAGRNPTGEAILFPGGGSDYVDFQLTSASKAAKLYLEFSKRGWAVKLTNW